MNEGSASEKVIVSTPTAPAAIGPYSQAVKAGPLVYTAGLIPLDPATMAIVPGDITAQAERVLASLAALLEASGSSIDRAVKTTCFLASLDDFPAFNAVYGRWFTENPPARSTVQVSRLPMGVLVEVECVALLK